MSVLWILIQNIWKQFSLWLIYSDLTLEFGIFIVFHLVNFRRPHCDFFFFFQRFYFFPFSPQGPPVHSRTFFIVGPSSCGMWDATPAWFDEQCHVRAQDSNQWNTGPPAAECANLTTRPRGQPLTAISFHIVLRISKGFKMGSSYVSKNWLRSKHISGSRPVTTTEARPKAWT